MKEEREIDNGWEKIFLNQERPAYLLIYLDFGFAFIKKFLRV